MDNELKQMLIQIMEGQTEIKGEIKSIDSRLIKVELIEEEIRRDVKVIDEV